MCGITGYYSPANFFSEQQLHEMTNAIAHRGPDSFGYYSDNGVGLGHRRLSILDLSDRGKQPMTSHDGRYVMVYNGEVYNFQEIALELQQQKENKLSFVSSSDSEVILEAFVKWRAEFVKKLNGMFAIAIYDTQEKELWIFRDRLGIKPLYYYNLGSNFVFASELKSLRKVLGKELSINNEAIGEFLHLGFIPAPNTIYNNLYKLEAGFYLKVSEKEVKKKQYWSACESISTEIISNESEAIITIDKLLKSSVQYQLKSDVPFGVFLSGGIDSSLLTAVASSVSTASINTFSIGFQENEVNESLYARKVAMHFNTNHNEFIVSHKDAMELVDKFIDVYDEPFSDSSAIPTMLVSKLAKQHVTVVLSGEGGDELFYGYGTHKWAKRLGNPLLFNTRKIWKSALQQLGTNKFKRGAKLFDFDNQEEMFSHIFSQELYMFSSKELQHIFTGKFSFKPFLWQLAQKEFSRKLQPIELQALFDTLYYLPDDLLTKTDRASMLYSLEARVPYLDHRLVEAALNISPRLKYKNGVSKYLLKQLLYSYIPEEYFKRPKQGFAIPLVRWLRYELRYLIEDNLRPEIINRFGLVNAEEVENLKKQFLSGEDYLFNRIWLLIVLHKWLLKFG